MGAKYFVVQVASFNPCFNGTTSATVWYYVVCCIWYIVSILVLMELPLQQKWLHWKNTKKWGFNPCFNGTTSATIFIYSYMSWSYRVSILVLMELPLQHPYRFNYMMLSRLVSILVLMELPLQRQILKCEKEMIYKFQSLF